MEITGKLRMAEGVEFIPLKELNDIPEFRDMECAAGDVVLNRPKSRMRAILISRSLADILQQFRQPATIVEAVIRYAGITEQAPQAVLTKVHPELLMLINKGYLVFNWDTAEENVFIAGDHFEGYEITRVIHKVVDTEIYEAIAEAGAGESVIIKIGLEHALRKMIRHTLDNELAILKTLKAECFPRLIKHGDHRGLPYLVINKIENVPLATYCKRLRDGYQHRELLGVLKKILVAYAALHREGVYHVDINPRNILVTPDGHICIIDFGMSVHAGSVTNKIPGVEKFSPPEATTIPWSQGKETWTHYSEQYCLAAVIYFLYTGRHYLKFSLDKEKMQRQIMKERPMSFARHGLTPFRGLEQVLRKALRKEPQIRFKSVEEFLAKLEQIDNSAFLALPSSDYALDNADLYRDTDDLIDKLSSSRVITQYFGRGPSCSLGSGSAGVAWFLHRYAMIRKSPELLCLADTWCSHALANAGTKNAFLFTYGDHTEGESGPGSILFHQPGIYYTQALISISQGDAVTTNECIAKLVKVLQKGNGNSDVAVGSAGIVVAIAAILEALPEMWRKNMAGLIAMVNTYVQNTWIKLRPEVPLKDDYTVKYIGVAHGWAGFIYAVLRWSMVSRFPVPESIHTRLSELFALREERNPAPAWKNKINSRTYYLSPGWCNGSAGLVETFVLAGKVSGRQEYIDMAETAAADVYMNASQVADICCGLAGRAYALNTLYRATANGKFLDQALDVAKRFGASADFAKTDSLYKGKFGQKLFELEIQHPESAVFPCM